MEEEQRRQDNMGENINTWYSERKICNLIKNLRLGDLCWNFKTSDKENILAGISSESSSREVD